MNLRFVHGHGVFGCGELVKFIESLLKGVFSGGY